MTYADVCRIYMTYADVCSEAAYARLDATELQQSCNRAATELQQSCNSLRTTS